jgi:hypothetical protein
MPLVNDQSLKSPSCLNHLKHGATATTLFLDDENPDYFFELLEDAFAEHTPGSKQSAGIVTRTVHDQWILLRRERACDNFEADLHIKKAHPADWVDRDLHEMELLDRYRTTAARAYSRSLNDLYKLKKQKTNEDRWRQHFELQKRRFDLDLERFNLAKEKAMRKKSPPPEPEPAEPGPNIDWEKDLDELLPILAAATPPTLAASVPSLAQTVNIGVEKGKTIVYERTPSNAQLRRTLREGHWVLRTYNFVGSVPPEYKHLITEAAVSWGKSTSVQNLYSFKEWSALIANE